MAFSVAGNGVADGAGDQDASTVAVGAGDVAEGEGAEVGAAVVGVRGVGVRDGVGLGPVVGVRDGVRVRLAVGLGPGVLVAEGVKVDVRVAVAVRVLVAVRVAVAVGDAAVVAEGGGVFVAGGEVTVKEPLFRVSGTEVAEGSEATALLRPSDDTPGLAPPLTFKEIVATGPSGMTFTFTAATMTRITFADCTDQVADFPALAAADPVFTAAMDSLLLSYWRSNCRVAT